MLRIYKTVVLILSLLIGIQIFGSCAENNHKVAYADELEDVFSSIADPSLEIATEFGAGLESVLSAKQLNLSGMTLTTEKSEPSYRSMSSFTDESAITSAEKHNLSMILWTDDERTEDLGCGFGHPHGWPNTSSDNRVEHLTHFAEFPWTVLITEKNSTLFLGVGTLIAPDIVITLASLLGDYTVEQLQVTAGEWDVESQDEILPHLSRSVVLIIKHPKFDRFTNSNDIALIVLNLSFSRQPNIRTVCLPTPAAVIDNSVCLTTTWSPPEPIKQKRFQYQIQNSDVCKNRLPYPYNDMDSSVICAIPKDDVVDSNLNSGAGLFCPMKGNPNRYTQMGIVIGSTERASKRTGLFVNVIQFMPWIYKQLGPRKTDLKYYLP